ESGIKLYLRQVLRNVKGEVPFFADSDLQYVRHAAQQSANLHDAGTDRLLAADGEHAAGKRAAAVGCLADAGKVTFLPVVESGLAFEKAKAAGDNANHVADLMADLMRHAHDTVEALSLRHLRLLPVHVGDVPRQQHDAPIRLARQ